jgi:hypothetical protein
MVFFLNAQPPPQPLAAGFMSMGSTAKTNIFSGIINPAFLTTMKSCNIGIYAERRFLVDGLNNYVGAIGLPVANGGFSISVNYFGSVIYNAMKIAIGYGRTLGTKMDVGIQLNYNTISLEGYGKSMALGFTLGANFHVSDKFQMNMYLSNLIAGKFTSPNAGALPAVYSMSWRYRVSDFCSIAAGVTKEEGHAANINALMEYEFQRGMSVRTGIATSSFSSSILIGIILTIKKARLDISSNYHPRLGITPALGLLFDTNDKTK